MAVISDPGAANTTPDTDSATARDRARTLLRRYQAGELDERAWARARDFVTRVLGPEAH